ncbi:MAG: glycosyltransferase family 4 protein [Verrucomicrobiota bacterium]|jgi:glycosyltransferase involved in cell wall biosynthesis|nr:glycosyltransferase family 4 protein [Verrucomicrobiota bacterium]
MSPYFINFVPEGFSSYSGLNPLVVALQGKTVAFGARWKSIQRQSWTVGNWIRQWGIRHYGCTWNSLLPYVDEYFFLQKLPSAETIYPVHFLWGEFGAPKQVRPYHRKGARVVVSVHCSARRWNSVWLRPDGFAQADQVVLMSESQRPFVSPWVSPERLTVIPHGICTDFFRPLPERPAKEKLVLFLLGNTERDHVRAARIARLLPPERFEWRIRMESHEKTVYEGIPCVRLLPRLTEAEFLREYQTADLLCMPMLDSAANNVLLESMACGTPVMVNRVGGVPEYVAEDGNIVMDDSSSPEEWAARLHHLADHREELERMRPLTRTWAERFDWARVADRYRRMYHHLLERG